MPINKRREAIVEKFIIIRKPLNHLLTKKNKILQYLMITIINIIIIISSPNLKALSMINKQLMKTRRNKFNKIMPYVIKY